MHIRQINFNSDSVFLDWFNLIGDEFKKMGFYKRQITRDMRFWYGLVDELHLLEDNQTFKKIVESLSKDEYFFQMFDIENLE